MDDFKLVYIFKALDEIRFRLQALEQNTTPARPAEQKPIQLCAECYNVISAHRPDCSSRSREFWLSTYASPQYMVFRTQEEALKVSPRGGRDGTVIHVREVMPDAVRCAGLPG